MEKLLVWLWLAALLAAPVDAKSPEGLEVAKWRADLAVLREQMPRLHGNLFHTMTREQFDRALDALEEALPRSTVDEVKVGILRLVAMVNDGHTRVRPDSLWNHTLPLRLHFFADGLFVVATDPAHAAIVGGRVTKIGRLSAEDAYAAARSLVAVDADNEGRRRLLSEDVLVTPEVLNALGATTSAAAADFTVEKDGRETTTVLPAETAPPGSARAWPLTPEGWVGARKQTGNSAPLWLQHPDRHYWHAYLADRTTLYVQYNQVADEPGGEPISAYFPRIVREADRRKAERLIIDVRLNGGGDNYLNRPIWHALIKSAWLNQKGRLWVVIGPRTFSAAMNFVDDMELNTNATFVGEPTGETPNMWGDAVSLTLPNSGIVVRTSTLWWQLEDPRDRRPFRAPDISAPLRSTDYSGDVDPALAAILKAARN